jgi:hypothetical protein
VPGTEYHAHATAADLTQQFVVAKLARRGAEHARLVGRRADGNSRCLGTDALVRLRRQLR